MNVFVVSYDIEYESGDVLGVCRTEEGAVKLAEVYMKREKEHWMVMPTNLPENILHVLEKC